jgi:hypothetical protein
VCSSDLVYSHADVQRPLPLLFSATGIDPKREGVPEPLRRAYETRPAGPPPASLIAELKAAVLSER